MKNGFKIFLIYLFIPLLVSSFFYDFMKTNLLLGNILIYLVLMLGFFFVSRKDLKKNLIDLKKNLKKYIIIIIKWIVIEFVLMMLSNIIIQLFIDTLPNNEINNRELITNSPFLALTYLLLLAPIIEEYVFRFSFNKISNYYLFTILTSALFAFMHVLSSSSLIEFIYFIPYFILGFGFANIYFKTKNYYTTVIGHIIHNLLCVIIIMLF